MTLVVSSGLAAGGFGAVAGSFFLSLPGVTTLISPKSSSKGSLGTLEFFTIGG